MSTLADYLITNAAVYTVDPAQPQAQAVAVAGNRLLCVGSEQTAQAWRGPHTQVIDAHGHTVLPGLIDSHFHLLWGSLKLDALQLDVARDREHFADLLHAYATSHPENQWIEGVQVRYNLFVDQPLDRHFLDAIVPNRPVYLTAYDGHTVWVNTAALRQANLLQGRTLPGLATGELREPEAFKPVRDLLPKPNAGQKRTLLKKGLAQAAAYGITSIHNMDSWDGSVALYADLAANHELTLRIYLPYNIQPETPLDALHEAAAWKQQYQGSHLRAGAVKLFMDGVLESFTALMVEEYAGAPGNRGDALFSAEHFNQVAVAADKLGLQIATHCCGDGAVRRALDGYEVAQRTNGWRNSRHRVEHIEVITEPDIARFAQLGVIASMQPLHAPPSAGAGDVWPSRAGATRWPLSFAWRTLRNAGAHLAFGSDWPVVTMDPWLGFAAALNRQPWQPGDPDQRQSLAETIAGYTRDAAYVEFQEDEKGMLRAGMLADLLVLDRNLQATSPAEIAEVRPVLTMCNGQVVFAR
jgi:predicted amidohydrolase YtcJ